MSWINGYTRLLSKLLNKRVYPFVQDLRVLKLNNQYWHIMCIITYLLKYLAEQVSKKLLFVQASDNESNKITFKKLSVLLVFSWFSG